MTLLFATASGFNLAFGLFFAVGGMNVEASACLFLSVVYFSVAFEKA